MDVFWNDPIHNNIGHNGVDSDIEGHDGILRHKKNTCGSGFISRKN
jgi:hypothetical protein